MGEKIVLAYHSIDSPQYPAVIGSFPVSMDRFVFQLESIQKLGYRFEFVSKLRDPISDDDKVVYITGDDGTVDWTKNVLPFCEKRAIPTHTGVITGPLESTPIYPLTHLLQIILQTRCKSDLQDLSDLLIVKYLNSEEKAYIDNVYAHEKLEYRRIIKGAFNFILDMADILELIGENTSAEEKLLRNRFETLEFYTNFKYAEIGVHTRSHWALGKDTAGYVSHEIDACRDYIAEKIVPTKYYTSPMKPRFGASVTDLIEPLSERGYLGIFDQAGIWDQESFVIPRIDAKDVERVFKLGTYRE